MVEPEKRDQVAGRATVVRRLKPLSIKAIVRGYLVGSDWKEYKTQDSVGWNKKPPAPELPDEIAARTAERSREALDWPLISISKN